LADQHERFYSFAAFGHYVMTPRIDWKWQSKVYFEFTTPAGYSA